MPPLCVWQSRRLDTLPIISIGLHSWRMSAKGPCMWFTHHPHSVSDVICSLAVCHSTFQAAFARNTAGFHHSAELQFALPVMPVQSVASPLCQFKPAVPVLQLAHMRSEVLCNAVQIRADYISLPLFTKTEIVLTYIYFLCKFFLCAQLCRCSWISQQRPTLP